MEENGKVVTQQYKNLEAQVTQMNQQQKAMEFQMGQLATMVRHMQNKGKFPSTTEPNPKEHCKAIKHRSGTSYQEPSIPNEHDGKGGKMTKQETSLKMTLRDPGNSKEEKGRKKGALKQTLKLEQNASLRGLDMEKKMMDLLCSREDEERKKKSSKKLKSEKGFEVGDEVLWNNSKVKGILGILKLKRRGILNEKKVHHGGSLEVENSDGDLFITNGTKVNLFHPTVPKEVPNIKLEREA
ncbi:hypothetical protein ACS0TY_032701 [Phlomoides rotata]